MLKKIKDSARGALTPSFGHCHAISKEEEGSTLALPTLKKYLDQAENQSIKQRFTWRRKTKLNLLWSSSLLRGRYREQCPVTCYLVPSKRICSPKVPWPALAKHTRAASILSWKTACCFICSFKQTQLFTSSSSDCKCFQLLKIPSLIFQALLWNQKETVMSKLLPLQHSSLCATITVAFGWMVQFSSS